MQINTGMRLMKEPNYSKFRQLIRDPAQYGDKVLARMFESCEKIGVSQNSYQLIYEGFWDLYCRKPASTDLNAKKLEPWSNLINLKVPLYSRAEEKSIHDSIEAEEDEEGKEGALTLPKSLPFKAVVRIRIPFKKPEPQLVEDEDGNTHEVIPEEVEGAPKEEIEPEDKILMLPSMNDQYRIYVNHQHASRLAREHIAKAFKEYMAELSVLDEEEMLKAVERDAELIENEFYALTPDLPVFNFEIN